MSQTNVTHETDDQPESTPTFIVGLGASAGGIEALTQFFEQVPADSGMAYVVILHLSPDYDSRLAQILQSVTFIPVRQVTEAVRVEANHVYVVPPDKQLQMRDGTIEVRSNARLEERRAPVDMFLRTLAESHGPLAIAVILSGTGANGSMGLKRVKEKGGAVFVQNPREAQFNEMPRQAIATDLVDNILPVAQIPARLLTYRESLGKVTIPEDAPQRPEEQQQALREVFTQLRVRTGHDFTNYKRATLLRRMERRISIQNLDSLPAYAAFLREHPDETHALLKDLLISVTNFFRDGAAFQYVEQQVLPALTQRGRETLRIWVAGCATGEEAYSLAMLCAEQTTVSIDAPKVQIFATDIDEDAIAVAREGLYTINDAADVSAERLNRFFFKEGDEYRVRREIREMVLFAHQNVLKDPPFSKLDLVTCRNLLIYFNHVAQERVMETFHFALNPGGYLLLGMSETVDGSGDLYATVSREHHLYQSRPVATRSYPIPESIPQLPQARKRSAESNPEPESQPATRPSFGDLHQQMLEQYAPPSIIVNEEYDILHVTPRAGRYLHVGGGELSKNLLKLIRPELRLELRTGLYQATQQQGNVEIRNLRFSVDGSPETLTLHIRPVLGEGNPARGFILVLFDPVSEGADDSETVVRHSELTPEVPMARQLEDELVRLKAQLRAANEHHELQAEELRASNEELQAMNEELRSAAEELETSKEELQSVNEELMTVNQELKVKVEETSLVSNNLQNLINSTDIATLFLDRSLRVHLFTPATREIFNLIPADFGRPLSDITNRLSNARLQADAEAVLIKLQPIEREVSTTDGRVFIMRVLPYRTAEDRINGVVLTFVDITDRKLAESALRLSEEQLSSIVNQATAGIARTNTDGTLTFVNQRYCDMLGYEMAEVLGSTMHRFTHPDDVAHNLELFNRLAETGEPFEIEKRYVRKDGSVIWVHNSVSPLYDTNGTITQVMAVSVDISDRKLAEEAVRRSEEKYRKIFENIDQGFSIHELIIDESGHVTDVILQEVNQAFEQHTGIKGAQGKKVSEIVPNLEPVWLDAMTRAYKWGETQHFEAYNSDTNRWITSQYSRIGGAGSRLLSTVFTDITERKQREQHQEFLLKLSDTLRATPPNADAVTSRTLQLLSEQLGLDRCYIAEYRPEVDHADFTHQVGNDRVPPLPEGGIRLSDFPEALGIASDRTLVIDDFAQTESLSETARRNMGTLGLRALVAATLRKGENNLHWVIVAVSAAPRHWTQSEITLVEEVTERTWAAVERARAEEALRSSNAYLNAVLDVLPVGLAIADVSGKVIRFNEALNRIWGVPPIPDSTADYADWKGRFADSGQALAAEDWAMARTLATGEPVTGDVVEIERFDGGRATIINAAAPIKDEKGQIMGGVVAELDITIQREAEKALRESEQRLASIRPLTLLGQTEELAEIGSWEYERSTSQFNWSDGMYRLFDVEQGQPIQPEIYLDFAVEADRQQAQNLVHYVHEGEGPFETSFRIRAGQQDKTIRIKAGVIGEGDQKRVLGVDLDITEQIQAEQQIQETAENLQAVLNASPASIGLLKAVYDPQQPEHILDFRLAVGNDKLAQFLGQPLDQLMGQSAEQFGELLWDRYAGAGGSLDVLRQVYYSGESRYEEKPMPGSSPDRWLALSVTREDDGVMLTGLDITELKRVQSQQGQWLNELEASRHSVDALTTLRASLNQRTELLRAVSHDLRGNFGVIQGALSLLETADSEDERAQMMNMVLRNVKQATGLLTDLLDLARLEANQQRRMVASFDASLLLRELSQSLQPMADEQALALQMAGPDTLVVENDQQLVYRMAQNLIINALKYTHQGNVTVEWGEAGDRWWFAVADTGPGLSPDLVDRLNSDATRSDATRSDATRSDATRSDATRSDATRQRGEGIGLRIVRELAHLLEAQLQVRSETGVGTHVTVSLPLRYVDV